LGSLLVWFGVAAAAGVGATGAVVATRHVTSVRTETPASAVAALPSPKLASTPGPNGPAVTPVATASVEAASEAPATAASSDASRRAPPGVNPPGAPAAMSATAVSAPPVADAPPSASASFDANTTTTLREEAALLQHAERALAASDPNAALAWLGEHERRFPSGALREERQAAKVLAFCALGRVAEARGLARAFLSASPGSVLVPRLERSCVGTSLKGR
ncbi:MAG TPA: hypothetical protein VMI54_17570, partial [Polyangiaceae bacterium]|nr:hypothetical protein [Polyangiaceae bacterium]